MENEKKHPLEIKSKEILDTVLALCAELEGDDVGEVYQSALSDSAMMICAKVASATKTDVRLLALQNAAIIRDQAEFLLTSTSGMKMFTKAKHDYIGVLRNEILEFRTLFVDWVQYVKTELSDDFEDEWGLFT